MRGVAVSAEGAAVQILPPMVATFRIWMEPRKSVASVKAEKFFLITSDFSIARWVTIGPMLRDPLYLIWSRSGISCKEMRTSGAIVFCLIITMTSVPPAIHFAFSLYLAKRVRASSKVFGLKYSNFFIEASAG